MPELVAEGECGLVVPPRDPQALARAILALADDPELRRALGTRARQRITSHFNIRTTIAQTRALYEQVLAER